MAGPGADRGILRLSLALLATALATRPARAEENAVPLAEAPGIVGAVGKYVILAIRDGFGQDASTIPVVALDGEAFVAAYQQRGGRDARRVQAFAHGGKMFVKRYVLGINKTILLHEALHVLSPRFTAQAQARGYQKLVEGVTDYLTHQVAPQPRFNQAGPPRSAYGLYEELARQIAYLVGEKTLRDCYFQSGYVALERRVDAIAGRGQLARAARRLQADDPGALAELSR